MLNKQIGSVFSMTIVPLTSSPCVRLRLNARLVSSAYRSIDLPGQYSRNGLRLPLCRNNLDCSDLLDRKGAPGGRGRQRQGAQGRKRGSSPSTPARKAREDLLAPPPGPAPGPAQRTA